MKKQKPVRLCPICNEKKTKLLRNFSFVIIEGHPISDGYDLVCCNSCGFIFANTTAGEKDYELFYKKNSKYEDNITSTGGGESSWDFQRFEEIAKYLSGFLPDPETKILDVGCANGGLLKALHQSGYNQLFGIDPSTSCVSCTQEKGFVAQSGTLTSNKLQAHEFDCVILSHVMEHLLDLRAAEQKICWLLKDNGFAYIEVPDASRYKDFIFSPFQDINTEHINHFSLIGLSNLFNNWQKVSIGQKIILSSPDKPYPALYSLFQYKEGVKTDFSVQKDNNLLPNILTYLNHSQMLMVDLETRIRSVIASSPALSKGLMIWGTGQLTMKLLTETCLKEQNIIAFIDGNPINQGKLFNQRTVLSPHQASQLPSEIPILISTTLHQQEIHDMIVELGILNPIIMF